MNAKIISIGTEILLGHIINSNPSFLSKQLALIGINVYSHSTLGDNVNRLCLAIKESFNENNIVITTGGLGPTVDDITTEAISKVFNDKLLLNTKVYEEIKKYFKKRHMRMPKDNIKQAYIPQKALVIKNSIGTAPGLIIKKNNKILIALPGPPPEMQAMFNQHIMKFLRKEIKTNHKVIKTRTIKISGISESLLHEKVEKFLKLSGSTTVGIYANPGEVSLKITAKAKNLKSADLYISDIEKLIKKQVGEYIFGFDKETLEEVTASILIKKNITLAIAESCTGGLLTSRLTDVAKASKFLLYSNIVYSNESKKKLLGVGDDILAKYGAVSKQAAVIMAKNIKKRSGADIGVAITGVAGPGGGSKNKPVGLVYIAISSKYKTECRKFYFAGERKTIKYLSSQNALNILRKLIQNNYHSD